LKLFNHIINRYILAILIITATILSFVYYKLNLIEKSNSLLSQLENGLATARYLFEEQKRYALSLSLLLSQDKEIKESFIKKDRDESFRIINKKIDLLKKLQNSQMDVQIHNEDLTTYLRSWDFSIKDIPLETFRKGLVKVKEQKKPLVSIELGKRLNIKAISPLMLNNKFIGSIEVIIGFDHLEKELKQKGFDTFILLNNKFLNIATTLKNKPKIKNFTLVNNKNQKIDSLQYFKLDKLKDYGYFTTHDKAFSYFSIYSLNREKLGYIIISLANEDNILIKYSYEKRREIENNRIIIE